MKKRLGFVTNSSSSSFICEVCGDVEAGYDMSLSDVNMIECENGHVMCEDHVDDYEYNENKVNERIKSEAIIKLYACLDNNNLADQKEKVEKFVSELNQSIEEFVMSSNVDTIINIFEERFGWEHVAYMNDYNTKWDASSYIGKEEIREGLIAEMCPLCQHEVVTDASIINHALRLLGMELSELKDATREYLIAQDNN